MTNENIIIFFYGFCKILWDFFLILWSFFFENWWKRKRKKKWNCKKNELIKKMGLYERYASITGAFMFVMGREIGWMGISIQIWGQKRPCECMVLIREESICNLLCHMRRCPVWWGRIFHWGSCLVQSHGLRDRIVRCPFHGCDILGCNR